MRVFVDGLESWRGRLRPVPGAQASHRRRRGVVDAARSRTLCGYAERLAGTESGRGGRVWRRGRASGWGACRGRAGYGADGARKTAEEQAWRR